MGHLQMKAGIALLLCISAAATKFDYTNYTVYNVVPSNEEQVNYLLDLSHSSTLDFWKSSSKINEVSSIMVPPKSRTGFLEDLDKNKLEAKVMIEDVQKMIKNEKVTRYTSKNIEDFDWETYHTMEDINLWLDQLIEAHSNLITEVIGGKTHLGRDIKGIKISYGSNRRGIFIEGTIHAREWISAATVTYIVNELLHSEHEETRRMAERYDWYIFPVTNPDGYIHSHEVERLWRKNRRQIGNQFGVDLNRNWNYEWGRFGTIFNPIAQTYGGLGPFSEEESRTLSEYIRSISSDLQMYIAFHSFSQLLLLPYGAPGQYPGDHRSITEIGRRAMGALSVKHNTQYITGTFADALYPASGTSTDWVKQALGVPVVVMYELRDRGQFGFLLPEDQIIPNCEEVMDSLLAIVREADRLGFSSGSIPMSSFFLLFFSVILARIYF